MAGVDPILGSSAKRDWTGYSVKGTLVSSRPRYIREQWGDAAWRATLARLQPKTRTLFESPILPFQWYPFDAIVEIDRFLVQDHMQGDLTQIQKFGSAVARYDLPTLYKVLFKLGTPSFLIKRVGTVYSTYIRGGTMTPSDVSSGRALVTLTEGSVPLYFCRFGIPGWFQAAVELSGGRHVMVRETACVHDGAKNCVWEATWA